MRWYRSTLPPGCRGEALVPGAAQNVGDVVSGESDAGVMDESGCGGGLLVGQCFV
jgi:hypothetical protein